MLFNSYIFIFAFLPITFIFYRLLKGFKLYKAAMAFLVVASLVFYSYQSIKFGMLLIGSILFNYALYLLFKRIGNKDKGRKALLILGLIVDIGVLFVFKYLNFFIVNINNLTGKDHVLYNIVLPLGISFYTFQQISFVIDSYKDTVPCYNFIEYALFVSFFPQLIAGPIVLHTEMVPQFKSTLSDKSIDVKRIVAGLGYFILGLSKKVLIADYLGRGVDYGYAHILYLNSASALFVILSYTLQIYFDFSGYCDMAIGLGRIFGFDITANFNSPYKSFSISEFWKRWHITLTRFLTTYVYIPLGGNKKGKVRTLINVMIVFLISGFWHGADWTFVLWGVLHGLLMVIERIIGKERMDKVPKVLRYIYTFGAVNLLWVLFRADTFNDALNLLKRILHGGKGFLPLDMLKEMFTGLSTPLFESISASMSMENIGVMLTIVLLIVAVFLATLHKNTAELVDIICDKPVFQVILGILFIVCVVNLSGVSTFLYFNF